MAMKPVEILIKARDEASGVFGTMGGKVAAVGAAIAGYFGVSAFVGAVKGAADLEAKLSEVKAVSGASAEQMVLLRKAAEAAGATTKFTATEGADALGNLARAGLSATDAIAALPAVLSLAQAGGIGLGEASEYVTKTVMGLGLAFTDAGRVADVLAAGANASNTSVTGLAQALSYAAPVANSLGLSLETTVAMIGKFADAGIDASRAGTALNAILSQFADPASKFRQELANAGITTNNFEQALRELAAAGPAGSKAILAVGTEAGPALRALLNQGIGALDDLKAKLDAAKGSAAATAAVMEDNLKGSLSGLSSAWDTVKNTLATPVLPVLRDGVVELTKSLGEAVSNGTIGKFGTAIATAFEGGLKWAREFLGTVDFAALTARMQNFASQAQEMFTRIGEYATNAGNIVQTAYGVMSAGTHAVLTGIYGIGGAFTEVAAFILQTAIKINEGLQKIAFGDAKTRIINETEEMRIALAGVQGVATELANKTAASFGAMGDAAQTARDGWTGLTSDSQAAATQAAASTQAFKTVAETLKEVGGDATAAGQKAQAAGILQKEAAEASRLAVADLKKEYEAAVATGNWQLAAQKIQELKTATDDAKAGITGLRQTAEEEAKQTAEAFTRMGIQTKTELNTAANTAQADFERIKASGLATADGLQTAFKKYAEAAIAANGGVAPEAIKSESAMYGLEVQVDKTGKAIVNAMGAGADATRNFGHDVRQTTSDLEVQLERLRAIQAIREKTIAPVANRDKITPENPYGLTSDGLKANKDGSAAGTFGSTLPIDQATKLKRAVETGQSVSMTQAELAAAKKQATDALSFLQEMSKLSAGAVSTKALQDAQALVNATNTARVTLTDAKVPEKTATNSNNVEKSEQEVIRRYMEAVGLTYTPGMSKVDADRAVAAKRQADALQKYGPAQTPLYTGEPPTSSQTYTVNLNINGQNTPVKVASQTDAQALITALQRASLTA